VKTEKAGEVRSPTMAPSPWGEVLLENERKDSIAPRKDEDDGFLSACDEVLSNEGPDHWGSGQSERRSPMADSAYHTRLEDDTLTKDRVETALKVLSTMSPADVQERLNAENLSTPIVSVKPKTQKKESTKKKLELVSPPHTNRRTAEEDRRKQTFATATTEEDDTEDELPVSQKRRLPAKSGTKKKAGLPKATESEIQDAALWSSSEEGAVATPSGWQTKCLVKLTKYVGITAFETFWAQFQNVVKYHQWTKSDQLFYLKSCLKDKAAQVLWDYGEEVPKSLTKLTNILKERFGGEGQKEKYRMELKIRRRREEETLEDLHVDIRRFNLNQC